MSSNELEELRRQLEQLKVVTSRLQSENRTLQERVNRLERESERVDRLERESEPVFNVGDRIRILNPTCPGRNREVIPQDRTATVTRVAGDWVCFTCDSGVKTKRIPSNI